MYQAPNTVAPQQGPTAMSTANDDKVSQEHFDDFYEEVCLWCLQWGCPVWTQLGCDRREWCWLDATLFSRQCCVFDICRRCLGLTLGMLSYFFNPNDGRYLKSWRSLVRSKSSTFVRTWAIT